ncbi:MAG: hypothetical protein HKN29_07285 [Rhodothermales bacterium]|nr:hypothetical protein [Rhodothermales bacterium]
MATVEAEIIHTGYAHSAEKMKDKYKVRLHLLEHEYEHAESARHRAYYGYQMGVVHYVLEEHERVLDLYGSLEYDELEDGNAFYTHLLAAQSAIRLSIPARSLVHCNAMLELDRSEPVAFQITGLALLQGHQFADGLLMLLEALSMTNETKSARFVLNGSELMKNLARLCHSAGLTRHAEAFTRLQNKDEFSASDAAEIIQSLKLGLVQTQRAVA